MPRIFNSGGNIRGTLGGAQQARPVLLSQGLGEQTSRAFSSGARLSPVNAPTVQARTLIDKVGPVVNAGQVIDVFEGIERRSLRIADQQNSLRAQEELIAYKDMVRGLNYGNVNPDGTRTPDGYLTTTGRATVEGHLPYSTMVDSLTQETLQKAPPAVREKMFPAVMAHKEATLNQAAAYAASQQKTWDATVREARHNASLTEIAEYVADPILGVQKHTAEARAIYPNDAQKWLQARDESVEVMMQTAISMDPESGSKIAAGILSQTTELISAPQRIRATKLIAVAKGQERTRQNQIRIEIENRNKEIQERTATDLFVRVSKAQLNGSDLEMPSESEILSLVQSGNLKPASARGLLASIRGTDEQTDWGTYGRFLQLIDSNENDLIDDTGHKISLLEEIVSYPDGLSNSDKRSLLGRIQSRKDNTFKKYEDDLNRFVDAQLGTGFSISDRALHRTKDQERISALAKTFITEALSDLKNADRLNFGEVEKIRNQLTTQFTKSKGGEVPLPRIYGATKKPDSVKEVEAQLGHFRSLIQKGVGERGNPIQYSKGWTSSQLSIVNQWMSHYLLQETTNAQ